VAYQLNAAHAGATSDALGSTPSRKWSVNLGAAPSYPLIVNGRVYVSAGNSLYALDASTGATVWGPVPNAGFDIAYDSGQIFALSFGGVMQAFNATTGGLDWATQLPGQSSFTAPPTASGGYVYTGGAGSGGTVYAVNESTGAVAWTAPVMNGDKSSPAVSAGGVYVSYACGQAYDFAPGSGALNWHRSTACEGGGGKTPVLANGKLYIRDFSYPAVLDAANGSVLSPFAASGPAPAVDASNVYDLSGSTLTARSLSSGFTTWSFGGDGALSSAPLVAGGNVLIGSTSGMLYALSSTTGNVIWSTNVGAAIPAPDEQNQVSITGLATSGGLLVVPAGNSLIAYG
jgi:outer membrane protein assembly factor BamB